MSSLPVTKRGRLRDRALLVLVFGTAGPLLATVMLLAMGIVSLLPAAVQMPSETAIIIAVMLLAAIAYLPYLLLLLGPFYVVAGLLVGWGTRFWRGVVAWWWALGAGAVAWFINDLTVGFPASIRDSVGSSDRFWPIARCLRSTSWVLWHAGA